MTARPRAIAPLRSALPAASADAGAGRVDAACWVSCCSPRTFARAGVFSAHCSAQRSPRSSSAPGRFIILAPPSCGDLRKRRRPRPQRPLSRAPSQPKRQSRRRRLRPSPPHWPERPSQIAPQPGPPGRPRFAEASLGTARTWTATTMALAVSLTAPASRFSTGPALGPAFGDDESIHGPGVGLVTFLKRDSRPDALDVVAVQPFYPYI